MSHCKMIGSHMIASGLYVKQMLVGDHQAERVAFFVENDDTTNGLEISMGQARTLLEHVGYVVTDAKYKGLFWRTRGEVDSLEVT